MCSIASLSGASAAGTPSPSAEEIAIQVADLLVRRHLIDGRPVMSGDGVIRLFGFKGEFKGSVRVEEGGVILLESEGKQIRFASFAELRAALAPDEHRREEEAAIAASGEQVSREKNVLEEEQECRPPEDPEKISPPALADRPPQSTDAFEEGRCDPLLEKCVLYRDEASAKKLFAKKSPLESASPPPEKEPAESSTPGEPAKPAEGEIGEKGALPSELTKGVGSDSSKVVAEERGETPAPESPPQDEDSAAPAAMAAANGEGETAPPDEGCAAPLSGSSPDMTCARLPDKAAEGIEGFTPAGVGKVAASVASREEQVASNILSAGILMGQGKNTGTAAVVLARGTLSGGKGPGIGSERGGDRIGGHEEIASEGGTRLPDEGRKNRAVRGASAHAEGSLDRHSGIAREHRGSVALTKGELPDFNFDSLAIACAIADKGGCICFSSGAPIHQGTAVAKKEESQYFVAKMTSRDDSGRHQGRDGKKHQGDEPNESEAESHPA